MIEDIDKISFAYDIMSRATSPFAKLHRPLFQLTVSISSAKNVALVGYQFVVY